jgi:hypothetical protein
VLGRQPSSIVILVNSHVFADGTFELRLSDRDWTTGQGSTLFAQTSAQIKLPAVG